MADEPTAAEQPNGTVEHVAKVDRVVVIADKPAAASPSVPTSQHPEPAVESVPEPAEPVKEQAPEVTEASKAPSEKLEAPTGAPEPVPFSWL